MLKKLGKYIKNVFTSDDDTFYIIRYELKEIVGWLLLAAMLIMLVVSEFGRTILLVVACALTMMAVFAAITCIYICVRAIVKHYMKWSMPDKKSNYTAEDAPYFVEKPEENLEERPIVYFWDRGTLMRNSAALYNCSLTGTFNKALFGQEADDKLITSDEELEGFRQLDGNKESAAYEMYISYIRNHITVIPERELPEIRLISGHGWSYVPMTAKEVLVARLVDYRNIEGVNVTIVTNDDELKAVAVNNGFTVAEHKK